MTPEQRAREVLRKVWAQEVPDEYVGEEVTIIAAALEQAWREGAGGEYRRGVEAMRDAMLLPIEMGGMRLQVDDRAVTIAAASLLSAPEAGDRYREGVEAIRPYAVHRDSCGYTFDQQTQTGELGPECTCGLNALLSAPEAGDRYREVREAFVAGAAWGFERGSYLETDCEAEAERRWPLSEPTGEVGRG